MLTVPEILNCPATAQFGRGPLGAPSGSKDASGSVGIGTPYVTLEQLFLHPAVPVFTTPIDFAVIVPVLAIAGNLALKKRLPVTAGTLPTHGPLFVVLIIGSVLLVGLLNYVPALALGPVVEHFMLFAGK